MSGIGLGIVTAPNEPDPALARNALADALPWLRRYARALTGSQQMGDAFVRAALSCPGLCTMVSRGRVELYRAFGEICNSVGLNAGFEPATGEPAHYYPAKMSPIQRQALMLTQLEEFSAADAGRILSLSPQDTAILVEQAVTEIAQDAPTDVLIIEDEPLISSHIEEIVEDMGHRVVAIAATAAQAGAAYATHRPGLVLADIQQADGSSGLTEIDDILAIGPIPIIFIAAFPEQLLTGERPEPSFLVTKPFREENLRATISQALFFGSSC